MLTMRAQFRYDDMMMSGCNTLRLVGKTIAEGGAGCTLYLHVDAAYSGRWTQRARLLHSSDDPAENALVASVAIQAAGCTSWPVVPRDGLGGVFSDHWLSYQTRSKTYREVLAALRKAGGKPSFATAAGGNVTPSNTSLHPMSPRGQSAAATSALASASGRISPTSPAGGAAGGGGRNSPPPPTVAWGAGPGAAANAAAALEASDSNIECQPSWEHALLPMAFAPWEKSAGGGVKPTSIPLPTVGPYSDTSRMHKKHPFEIRFLTEAPPL